MSTATLKKPGNNLVLQEKILNFIKHSPKSSLLQEPQLKKSFVFLDCWEKKFIK